MKISLFFVFILIILFSIFSFFFSAAETAIIALSKIRVRHLVSQGIKRALSIQRLSVKLDKFITAILVGNNFVNIAISSLITALLVGVLGYRWGVVFATITATFYVLIFCDITPKLLSIKHTEKIALFCAPIMEKIIKLFNPLFHVFIGTSNFILKLLRTEVPRRSPLISEEELKMMIEIGKEEGVLTEEERKMLQRIFSFGDTKVKDVMIPREKMVAININSSLEEILDILAEEGHARIPVYRNNLDDIAGIMYVRDLLYLLKNGRLFVMEDILSHAYFVSPDKRINELLKDFQVKKVQIALVKDGKGVVQGLVTLEDLIEEIVGEIDEKFNR